MEDLRFKYLSFILVMKIPPPKLCYLRIYRIYNIRYIPQFSSFTSSSSRERKTSTIFYLINLGRLSPGRPAVQLKGNTSCLYEVRFVRLVFVIIIGNSHNN